LIVLSIFAPFTAEELWNRLGEKTSVHTQTWPTLEEEYLEEEKVTIAVQVDGKLRDTLEINNSKITDQKEIEKLALESAKVKKHIAERNVKRIVFVPGKIVSIVTIGK
jgi:leucyl-tRNA synthetase